METQGFWRNWLPQRRQLLASRWLRWLMPWLARPALWRWSRRGVALGVGIGVFFGLLIPLAQIPLSAAAAVVLRANLPAAAASTLVTNPLTMGPVYYGAYRLGGWLTGESSLPAETPAGAAGDAGTLDRIMALGRPLLLGLSVMACLAGFLAWLLVDLFWRLRSAWRRRRRRSS
ncbi:DUF2062 domain-containing protein [Azonexus sp.]|uniref:DUF2062 domain-containing protein n=1 Tax=Azonexus sp. TaxID=1872668 RepID=UPI0035B3F5C4